MPIKITFRRRYINGITKRHAQHKQAVIRILHKIRSHPAFLKPGAKPSTAAVPKSIPKQPANLNAKGAGFWSSVKKGWNWVKKQFHAHKGKVVEAAKKHGAAAGQRLMAAGGRAASNLADRAIGVAERNIEHYTNKAERKIQGLADKAEAHISKYDKPKTGSGLASAIARRVSKTNFRPMLQQLQSAAFQGRLAPGAVRIPNLRKFGRRRTMAQQIGLQKRRGARR